MAVGEIDRAAAELDALRVARERGDEDQARRDRLGEIGDVLADERLLEAQALRQQHRLAILGQRLAPVAPDRMQRHGEVAQLHARPYAILAASSSAARAAPTLAMPLPAMS